MFYQNLSFTLSLDFIDAFFLNLSFWFVYITFTIVTLRQIKEICIIIARTNTIKHFFLFDNYTKKIDIIKILSPFNW